MLRHAQLATAHIATVPAAVTCLMSTLLSMAAAHHALEIRLMSAQLPHALLASLLSFKVCVAMICQVFRQLWTGHAVSAVATSQRTALWRHVQLATTHIATGTAAAICPMPTLLWMAAAHHALEIRLLSAQLPYAVMVGYLDHMPTESVHHVMTAYLKQGL